MSPSRESVQGLDDYSHGLDKIKSAPYRADTFDKLPKQMGARYVT